MSVTWAGRNEWSLRLGHTPQPRGWLRGTSARRVAADRAVRWFPNRRRPVRLSEWRDVLDALAALPTIAAGGCCSSSVGHGLPVPPAALTFGAVRSATDDAHRTVPMHAGRRLL